MSEVRIAAEPRTEFGKGPARRSRRAGKVPAVLYGHGGAPQHINLPGYDLMMALKTPNVLLRVHGVSGGSSLALPKEVQRDPIKGFLKHVDLIMVRKGEQVVVDIPVHVAGDIAPGGMLDHQLVQISVEAEATQLPESIDVDVEGFEVGTVVYAKDLRMPSGAKLAADEDALVLHVVAEKTAEEIEAEVAGEEAAEAPAEPAVAAETEERAESE